MNNHSYELRLNCQREFTNSGNTKDINFKYFGGEANENRTEC